MKTLSYFAASSAQITTHPIQLLKLEWKGGSSLAAARFLQIHDSYGTPAEASVPVKCWPIYTDAPGFKLFDVGELNLTNGLYVCVSTTEATKTLASGSDVFSTLTAELREAESPTGTSFAGDLTTARETLQVWAESAGPKNLHEIIATNSSGSDLYLQIHANDSPFLITAISLVESLLVKSGATKRLTFGNGGLSPFKEAGGNKYKGCTLAWSSTAGIYTGTGANSGNIKAEYK